MCGIACYWAKESLLLRDSYHKLIEGASFRGKDGLGIGIYSFGTYTKHVWLDSYIDTSVMNSALDFIEENMMVGSVLFVSCRATPETEFVTTDEMIQPIHNNCSDKLCLQGMILLHNGGVTDSMRQELGNFNYSTPIDSEMILANYVKNGKNMVKAMEGIVGSFAFVLLDIVKDKLYAVTSFNPLAHMYIRGYGYFLHSDNDVLSMILQGITGQTCDGVNVWESWYHHYIDGYTIIETDLQSGFQFKQGYKPRFLHPMWNSLVNKERKRTLVVASGGIDSGFTSYVLHLVGRKVHLVHFLYGQKSEECELWSVQRLSEELNIPLTVFDLRPMYGQMGEKGMLTTDSININSGGELLKSTIAWVSGRNVIFASMTMALAESLITQGLEDYVDISAGWAQLSEECGGYPDNSFQFTQVLQQMKMYGYITGSRMEFLPVMQRITKTEEWVLGHALKFPFDCTVSCDEPKMVNGLPHLCTECGSTKLSILASDRAGVPDPRMFLTPRPILSEKMKSYDIGGIIDRLILDDDEKVLLRNKL